VDRIRRAFRFVVITAASFFVESIVYPRTTRVLAWVVQSNRGTLISGGTIPIAESGGAYHTFVQAVRDSG